MARSERIRVGVIGCGALGKREAEIVRKRIPGVDLVAVADASPQGAKTLAFHLGIRGHYSSYQKMFDRERLGAVLVATPTYTHKEICIDACKAGLHVFCEKPMALTAADCRTMIEAADKHEVRLMPGFQRRFQSIFREMKRRIEAGEIGEPRMAFAVRMGARTPPGVGGWRPIRSKGGGLFSGYCHEVDLLRWFVGEYKSVRAVANAGTFANCEVEDHIFWTFEFDNGAVGSLGASQAFGVGCYELGVAGAKASLKYDGVNRLVWCAHGQGFENIELAPNDPLVEELLYFFTCLREGTNPSPNAHDGLKNLEVIEAAHKSVQTGKVVVLS